MSELQQIERPDGKKCPVYVAEPSAAPKGGVVVIQEWWGLNAQIKKVADRVAAAGYRAVVPDLYRGKLASDADEANHEMSSLDFMDATTQDIQACSNFLQAAGKVAVMGFCMGGALTILSAVKASGIAAGVCFYGIPPREAADPADISVPMLFHFATDDDWCNAEAVAGLEERLKAGNVVHELHRYEAQHAFMNEARPEVYVEAHAKTAWDRSLAFFAKNL